MSSAPIIILLLIALSHTQWLPRTHDAMPVEPFEPFDSE